MKKIRELVEAIREEVNDAGKYATKAVAYKAEDKQLADMYLNLARQELDHADREHNQVVRVINEAKASGEDVPETMMAIWDWQHRKIIEDTAEVRVMLDMYAKG